MAGSVKPRGVIACIFASVNKTEVKSIMEISIKSITMFSAVMLTGLSAGLFYAWAVSVIPGTKRVPDTVYLETMQAINRAILNPAFYLIFFGSLFLLVVSTIQQFQAGLSFWLMLAATLIDNLAARPLQEAKWP